MGMDLSLARLAVRRLLGQPFPCAPAAPGVQYAELASFFERLEGTPGRLDMTRILVELLGHVKKGEMAATVRLLQGAIAPDWEGVEVGLAPCSRRTVAAISP